MMPIMSITCICVIVAFITLYNFDYWKKTNTKTAQMWLLLIYIGIDSLQELLK